MRRRSTVSQPTFKLCIGNSDAPWNPPTSSGSSWTRRRSTVSQHTFRLYTGNTVVAFWSPSTSSTCTVLLCSLRYRYMYDLSLHSTNVVRKFLNFTTIHSFNVYLLCTVDAAFFRLEDVLGFNSLFLVPVAPLTSCWQTTELIHFLLWFSGRERPQRITPPFFSTATPS